MDPPTVTFAAETDALYTIMIEDNDINIGTSMPAGVPRFFHWLVANVPGTDVASGDVIFDYIPSFTFKTKADAPEIEIDPNYYHRHVLTVWKQNNGAITPDEGQQGCTSDITEARTVTSHDELAAKYDLTLVAGNFYRNYYNGPETEELFCFISKCSGVPWPYPIPGVTDDPECQA
jgi:hypothetical protein